MLTSRESGVGVGDEGWGRGPEISCNNGTPLEGTGVMSSLGDETREVVWM